MKNKLFIRVATICMAAFMAFTPVNASAATLIKLGSKGSDVQKVQTTLKNLGYYTYPKITGYYGSITAAAVKRFQRDNGITADGIIGVRTKSVLFTNTAAKMKSSLSLKTASIASTSGSAINTQPINVVNPSDNFIGALDWFKTVRDVWQRGMIATVTDVDTGKSFQVKRTYGTNHADVEPMTAADTATIKEIWNGFSWTRRAVIVQVGDYTLAGSMTAMPHAGLDSKPAGKYISGRSAGYGWGYNLDAVKNNGASGVMDIHFLNSRTHSTNVIQKSQQDMVKKAAAFLSGLNL